MVEACKGLGQTDRARRPGRPSCRLLSQLEWSPLISVEYVYRAHPEGIRAPKAADGRLDP